MKEPEEKVPAAILVDRGSKGAAAGSVVGKGFAGNWGSGATKGSGTVT
jgi:hypothetical protein